MATLMIKHFGLLTRGLSNMAASIQPVVISGPSGSGKSTLVKKIMAEFEGCFAFSVSHTTRKPRPGEEHGKDYYYIERDEMLKKIENNDFVEHAEFSGNMYGTSTQAIEEVRTSGRICILDVDMQGVKSIKKTSINPKYIFCKPPTMEILEQRLRGRGTETEEAIQKRLNRAQADMDYGNEPGAYDHIIVNDELEIAYEKLKGVLMAGIYVVREGPHKKR